jgi:2-oxo-4-hydroxy-4-carboxy--5-ureidoimidazoline (OHCU) decarboxylase
VGLQGYVWVATPADAFGEAFEISDHELSVEYAVRDFERPESERDIMMRVDREASTEARVAYAESHPESIRAKRRADQLAEAGLTEGPPEGSPEAFFARQEAPDA